MAVDQPRRDPAAVAIGASPCIERGGRIGCRSGIDDAAIGGGDHPILDQAEALARRRQRCKTAAMPDVIDRCHEPWGSSANAMRLRDAPKDCLFVYTYYRVRDLSSASRRRRR